jgi:hypothetical protein
MAELQNQHWCMCEKLECVARDGRSTCSICGGQDAYGLSTERPEDKKKTVTTASTRKPLLEERVKSYPNEMSGGPLLEERVRNYPKVQRLLDKYADKAYPIIDKCDIEAALTEVLDDVDRLSTEQIKLKNNCRKIFRTLHRRKQYEDN